MVIDLFWEPYGICMCFLEIQVWFVVILKFCGLYTSDLEFLGFVNICWKSYVAIILCIQSNKSEISFALVLSYYSWDGFGENLMIMCSDIADTSLLNMMDIWISYEA